MNLLCGVMGVIFSFKGQFDVAFFLMIGAAVCDFLDGFCARALGAYSEMGKELDSLSDLVSFGLLPAVMMYCMMDASGSDSLWCYVPLAITVFSALRLAKFNVDTRQNDNFIGLPTPACAMLCGSLVYYINSEPDSFLTAWGQGNVFLPILSIVLCVLLVSEIPMFSMKIKKGQHKGTPNYRLRVIFVGIFASASLIVLLLGLNWSMIILLTFISYIIENIVSLVLNTKI